MRVRPVQPVAGFLPNPSLLQPGQEGQPDLVYRSPTANFAGYRSVMLDPVAIWTSPGSPLSKEPKTQRRALANTFYSDLYTALSQHCQMTQTPSPGTLRARVARSTRCKKACRELTRVHRQPAECEPAQWIDAARAVNISGDT